MFTKREGAPKASLLWLNYNSSSFIDVVLKSLESLFNIDYPDYEVIIIDNGSSDGSINVIEDSVRKATLMRDLPPIKVVKNSRNLGFTGGNYVGYKHRSEESSYIVLVNNDLVVEPSSLMPLVKYLEEHGSVVAVQGKITSFDGSRIDNCGFYFDSTYRVYGRYSGYPPAKGNKKAEVSYVSGCYSVYRANALEELGGLFGYIRPYFGYFDDADTCLRLWRKGYKVSFIPVLAGRHKGGPSYPHPLRNYLDARNRLSSILNLGGISRFMIIPWTVYLLSRIFVYLGLSVTRDKEYKTKAKYVALALANGLALARRTKKIEGDGSEPCVKLHISTIVRMMLLPSHMTPTISCLANMEEACKMKV